MGQICFTQLFSIKTKSNVHSLFIRENKPRQTYQGKLYIQVSIPLLMYWGKYTKDNIPRIKTKANLSKQLWTDYSLYEKKITNYTNGLFLILSLTLFTSLAILKATIQHGENQERGQYQHCTHFHCFLQVCSRFI